MDYDPTDDEVRLVARLRELPEELEPERDLWPGIAAKLERPRPMRRVILQLAAAIAIFITGVIAGSMTRRAPVPHQPERQPPPERIAAEIQRQGSEYVAAISSLARETDERDRMAGREVALATIYGALFELDRATGDGLSEAMRSVDQRRDEVSNRADRISLVRF